MKNFYASFLFFLLSIGFINAKDFEPVRFTRSAYLGSGHYVMDQSDPATLNTEGELVIYSEFNDNELISQYVIGDKSYRYHYVLEYYSKNFFYVNVTATAFDLAVSSDYNSLVYKGSGVCMEKQCSIHIDLGYGSGLYETITFLDNKILKSGIMHYYDQVNAMVKKLVWDGEMVKLGLDS